jgi:hypothetical protein
MVPTPALLRVDIDANEGLGVRAINLAHAVVEYEAIKFTSTVLQTAVVHSMTLFGLLFQAQQSCDSIVPERDLYPTGHVLHDRAAVAFENVSAAHERHGEESGIGLNEPGGQDTHTELFMPFGACPKLHVLHESASEL